MFSIQHFAVYSFTKKKYEHGVDDGYPSYANLSHVNWVIFGLDDSCFPFSAKS